MSLFPLFEKLKHYMYYSLSYYYVYYIFFKMKHWEKKAYNMDHEQSERRKKKRKKERGKQCQPTKQEKEKVVMNMN